MQMESGGDTLKPLICVSHVKEAAAAGKHELYVEPGAIITAAASDYARDKGIAFVEKQTAPAAPDVHKPAAGSVKGLDKGLGAEIVRQVLLSRGQAAQPYREEKDDSGLKVVRGHSVTYEVFDTGNPVTKVGYREVISKTESHMSSGFLTIDHSSFTWTLTGYEETDIILEGSLSITINGKTYYASQGDVLFIPKDATVVWNAEDHVKLFYSTYPADWAG